MKTVLKLFILLLLLSSPFLSIKANENGQEDYSPEENGWDSGSSDSDGEGFSGENSGEQSGEGPVEGTEDFQNWEDQGGGEDSSIVYPDSASPVEPAEEEDGAIDLTENNDEPEDFEDQAQFEGSPEDYDRIENFDRPESLVRAEAPEQVEQADKTERSDLSESTSIENPDLHPMEMEESFDGT